MKRHRLIQNLLDAEARVQHARQAIIIEIQRRLDEADVAPAEFARATGINKGNLYNMLSNGKWNRHVADACAEFLDTPIRQSELDR